MKLSRYLGPILLSMVLTAGCGSRQQPLTTVAQPPLTGDKPSPLPAGVSARQALPAGEPAGARTAPADVPEISIPAGTAINVRLMDTIDTKRNRSGDRFEASLTNAIAVNGQTAIPRGTRFTGHLVESQSSGRLKGHAELSLSLDSFEMNGRRYEINTTHVARESGGQYGYVDTTKLK